MRVPIPGAKAPRKPRATGPLRKLRRRLVLIIMSLTGSVMLLMVAMSSANAQASLDQLVSRSLDRALELRADEPAETAGLGMEHLPVLWVDVSANGVVLGSNQSQLSMDSGELSEALQDALSSSEDSGRLDSYHLTWRTVATQSGWRVAIADTSSIDAARTAQVLGDLRLAAGGLILLLAIALALSRWALKPVELAWKQQHQFVADASHELKTPLAVILANTQILRKDEGAMPDDSRRWVESTAEEAERMKGLVEGLLELARTEEGAGSARRNVDVDLSSTVEGEALQFDAVAFERGCTISADVAEGLHVSGDPDQLERLVKTLVDNACKYAREGTEVSVVLRRQGQQAELGVTNQGTPIDAADLPHVFDRFWRSDKARARSTGGYGLGLAIAKGIVESHGGKISVTSDETAGTRFCVRLPLASK